MPGRQIEIKKEVTAHQNLFNAARSLFLIGNSMQGSPLPLFAGVFIISSPAQRWRVRQTANERP
jgi:hypothetical protein